jgi:hypothetical protein
MNDYLTTFESSLQIISLINAEKIVLTNGGSSDYETNIRHISEQRNKSLMLRDDVLFRNRKFEIFGFEQKKYVVFQNNNETIEQNLNLLSEERHLKPDIGMKNVLKVNGTVILKPNNTIDIVLVESG